MSASEFDPIDGLLRAVRPVRSEDYLRPGDDPAADAMLRRITTTIPVRRRRSWKRITFFVTGACVLAGAGVTTAVLRSRAPEDPTQVACYSSAVPAESEIYPIPGDADRTALEQCRDLWLDGTIAAVGGIPSLTACVTDDGLTAVLPGEDVLCADLGWDVAELGVGDAAHPATELQSTLSDRFGVGCVDRDRAITIVSEVIRQLGLDDWSTETTRAVAGECNTFAIEPLRKTVVVAEIRQ
jgi:hypothetical protein